MLQGLGRFRALFDEEKVVPPCFGAAIVGLHIEALGVGGCFLFRATLNNITSKISGDTITGVGKEVLRACKKYLASWKDCLDVNGDFKSGLNEDSALLFVRKAMWAETSMATIVLEEEKSGEEPHHIDFEKDTGKNHNECKMPPNWYPPHYSAFVFNGPYSKMWGFDTSELFSVDARWLDAKKSSRSDHRTKVKKENDTGRKVERDRGMPSAVTVQQDMTRAQTEMSRVQTEMVANSSRFNKLEKQMVICEKMLSYEKNEEAKERWMEKIRIYASQLTESVVSAPIALNPTTSSKKKASGTIRTNSSASCSSESSENSSISSSSSEEDEEYGGGNSKEAVAPDRTTPHAAIRNTNNGKKKEKEVSAPIALNPTTSSKKKARVTIPTNQLK
jgi:hypothetical protein